MVAQHSFNLRVSDVTYIPIEEVKNNSELSAHLKNAVSVTESDPLLEILSNSKNSGKCLLVKDKHNMEKGLITSEQLVNFLSAAYKKLLSYFDAVLRTVNEAVTAVDSNNKVLIWNQNAEDFYRLSAEKILGADIEDYFANSIVTQAIHENTAVNSHYHQPCPGVHVLVNAVPVRQGQQLIGGVSCGRNITDVVRLNNELSKASSQVNLLKHEISKISGRDSAFNKLVGRSRKIQEIREIGRKVAGTAATILIKGESGTGKELFARAVHLDSPRRNGPFITVNCGAIPNNLFESELFGYAPGALIGGEPKGKPGMLELAHGGTIFLDEVGELPLDIQAKLFKALQNKYFNRIGSSEPIKVDVHIIAATHRDLESMVAKNQFREDLYYYFSVVTVNMPSLRERKEDIPELMHLFIQEFSQTYGKVINKVDPEVTNIMMDYSWPGNVRELKNVVERLVVLVEDDVITKEYLPENLRRHTYISLPSSPNKEKLTKVAVEAERQVILKALERCNGNKSAAARFLGIPRSTLYYKLRHMDISEGSGKHSGNRDEK